MFTKVIMHTPLVEALTPYVCPQDLLELLPKGSRFLLESTLVNKENRWAILGCDPQSVFVSKGGRSYLDGTEVFGNPFDLLSVWIRDARVDCEFTPFPFLGGWLGCVSYEAARFLEKLSMREDVDFDLVFYKVESFFLFDLFDKKVYGVGLTANLRRVFYSTFASTFAPTELRRTSDAFEKFDKDFTKDAYQDCIARIQEHIRNGETYQVNLSQRFSIDSKISPFEVYKSLASISPVPFAGFFEWKDLTVISGSPERLFEIQGEKIRTRPIAGTRRCGTEEEVQRFMQELVRDPKEHAEHSMLVDLARNDLGRICKHGSVYVKEYMDVVRYKTILHTESEIEGELLENLSFTDIMKALFPGGTITGVPKIRTMEIIHDLEPCARGIYTGSMGYWSVCGHADFNIMIRPIYCKQGVFSTHAGGGITIKADAHREYKETLNKARAQVLSILHAMDNA